MNFFFHFNEIRIRFIYINFCFVLTFLASYNYSDILLFLMTKPLNKNFMFINIFEGFYCVFIVSVFLSLYFISFFSFYSLFDFLKPGLTKNETNLYLFIIRAEIFISLITFNFLYNIFLPHLIKFLLSFEQNQTNNLINFFFQARLLDYILVFWSLFCVIISLFQIPFLVFLSVQFKLVNNNFFIKFRREFIIFFFILGCLLSPPDILSQLLIVIPCLFFYEIFIFLFLFSINILESRSNR
uniref:TatC n=1 Tax=Storeatula sp. CCMP1868 TaxID=195070 RepID=A0A2P1G889_9CRYP|nr:tatC [Storeatula sp. CCMP1868]AVM81153.1 tatC [Storeatula sp. CCMP1868]